METWWYSIKEYTRGPVGVDELSRLFIKGTLTPSTPVWREGMDSWARFGVKRHPDLRVKATPSFTSCQSGNILVSSQCQGFF